MQIRNGILLSAAERAYKVQALTNLKTQLEEDFLMEILTSITKLWKIDLKPKLFKFSKKMLCCN